MKKSIILFGGLLFLTTQSCDVLDKEPLDSISTQQYFANANAQALEQYCNDLYPKLITGHGNPNEYNFGMMETDFQSDDLLPWDANSVAFSQHSISTADNESRYESQGYKIYQCQYQFRICLQLGLCPQLPGMFVSHPCHCL
jgi:hypothetical protein